MKVAIYSHALLTAQGTSESMQQLRNCATTLSWETEVVEYIEHASQHPRQRSVFEQLMADAGLQRFEVVIVASLHDLGRSREELVSNVGALERFRIRLLVPSIGLDSKFRLCSCNSLAALLRAFADFEQDVVSDRIRAGVAVARQNGKRLGRRPREFSRDLALELRECATSWRAIGRQLGVPPSTVRGALVKLRESS